MKHGNTFSVLLLAGYRPGSDPICNEYQTRYKSLVPVAGQPMILYPLKSLSSCEHISDIIVLAQEPEIFRAQLKGHNISDKVRFCSSNGTIASTILETWENLRLEPPLLITTADNCLLRTEHIDDFLPRAIEHPSDLTIGFLHKDKLLATHPGSRRTWLPFRDAEITSCNLFLLQTEKSKGVINIWKDFESCPKKAIKIAWGLGPVLFWHYWNRNLSVTAAFEKISDTVGATIKPVFLDNPDIAIDIDKLCDLHQVEEILDPDSKAYEPAYLPAGRVVIFDLDRTITKYGTYTPFLIFYALRHNPLRLLLSPVVVLLMMACQLKLLGRKQLKSIMFGLLAGRPAKQDLETASTLFVEHTLEHYVYADALNTIRYWKNKGAHLILATASYDWLADVFARHLRFDQVVATRSIEKDGHIIPGVDGENCYGTDKLGMVSAAAGSLKTLQLSGREIWFYTDHHTDICLLEQCTHPVAVNPTGRLADWANATMNTKILLWKNSPDRPARQGISATEGLMKYSPLGIVLAIVMSIAGITFFTSDTSLADTDIALANVPPAVIQAATAAIPGIVFSEAEIEMANGSVVYELEGTHVGREYEIEVSMDGKILEIEESISLGTTDDIGLDKVPLIATRAVMAKLPHIIFSEASMELVNGSIIYELEGVLNGRKYEIDVSTEGIILEIEEDDRLLIDV